MRKLFGTDGIRGVAGQYPLDERTIFAIGAALGSYLQSISANPQAVIGEDTRESSHWIACTLAAGLESRGVPSESAGVITTPGVAYLARTGDFTAGAVISASHNPWRDNGIKIFGHDGFKLPDHIELEIERRIFSELEKSQSRAAPSRDSSAPARELRGQYSAWLTRSISVAELRDFKIVVDCANGAATRVAAEIFKATPLRATFTHAAPDGRNINQNCGALHPDVVATEVQRAGADLGVCFDGDADRALFADRHGHVVNGDAVLLLAARDMKTRGRLAGDTVVATTMSNMGLEIALRRSGIRMLRAPVGDKYVLEEMLKTGAALGGEQSGHIIFRDGDATTGDGLLTALRVLEIVSRAERPLDELVSDLHVFPQTIRNVHVREKRPFAEVAEVERAIRRAEQELKDSGRVIVRYSGTEKLARVMIEAESEAKMREHAEAIAGAIQAALGE
jgi:phosphoglucosamine mutase